MTATIVEPVKKTLRERFDSIVRNLPKEVDILVTQVDPDALGSAVVMRTLIERANASVERKIRIVYCGNIGHPQNRAIVNRCDLNGSLVPVKECLEKGFNTVVLVDSSSLDDSRLPQELRKIRPSIVVDHHKNTLGEPADDQFFMLSQVGAASTLIAELSEELGTQLTEMEKLLLALGIYTDTKALMSADARDSQAYALVTEGVKPESLTELIHYDLPASYFTHLAQALQSMKKKDGRLVANLGRIEPESGDDISSVADHLSRMEGITLVVVWALIGNMVRISARNSNLSVPLDLFLRDRFGSASGAKLAPDGRGEGGATLTINLGILGIPAVDKELVALCEASMQAIVFNPPTPITTR